MIYKTPGQPWYSLMTAIIYVCHWLCKHCCNYKGCLPQILLWYWSDSIHFPFLAHLLCVLVEATWLSDPGHFGSPCQESLGLGNEKRKHLFLLQNILVKNSVFLSLDANSCIKWPIKRVIFIWAFFGYPFVLLVNHLFYPIHFAFVHTVGKQKRDRNKSSIVTEPSHSLGCSFAICVL